MDRYEALKHAVKAHAGQLDRCGKPYVLHPMAVAEAIERGPALPLNWRIDNAGKWVRFWREDIEIIALLHDVWEDTDYELPISETDRLFLPLAAITRMIDEPYSGYIARVCANPNASIAKLADLYHNLSPERQACLPGKEQRSLEKRYLKARDRIWEGLGFEWWPR